MRNKKTHCLDHLYSKVLILKKLINQMKLEIKIFKCSFHRFPTFLQYQEKKVFEVNFPKFSYKNLQIYKTKTLLKNKTSKISINKLIK